MPSVQVYFCIDVRSEVFRRAWEVQSGAIQTAGFAGFFGLPIDFTPLGTTAPRPQLPGLLASQLSVVESSDNPLFIYLLVQRRQARLSAISRWITFQFLPSSAFTFVKSAGVFSLLKLVRNCFPNLNNETSASAEGLFSKETKVLKPRLVAKGKSTEVSLHIQIELCAKILRAMSLTKDFARIVLLVGHGSQSANNAHASGLDCEACCGQSGEVNARAYRIHRHIALVPFSLQA